jgi:hypothetical protein
MRDDVANAATEREEERFMKNQNFTSTFSVDQTSEEAFVAVNNLLGWWSGEIDGSTDALGAEFKFQTKTFTAAPRRSLNCYQVKTVWHVSDSNISFAKDISMIKSTGNER